MSRVLINEICDASPCVRKRMTSRMATGLTELIACSPRIADHTPSPCRYLLRNARALRWERIFDWLDGSVAAAYVYLLLSYLDRHRLTDIAPGVLHEFFLRQRAFGRTNLAILHALLDRYVADGREFGLLGWMALRLGRQMARPV